jgi:hypothetical protein
LQLYYLISLRHHQLSAAGTNNGTGPEAPPPQQTETDQIDAGFLAKIAAVSIASK